MRIINIDAPIALARKVVDLKIPEFVLDVIRPLERELRHHDAYYIGMQHNFSTLPTLINKCTFIGCENIAELIHVIPIYLKNCYTKPDGNKGVMPIQEKDGFACYFTKDRNIPHLNSEPYIELYLPLINEQVSEDDEFKWLFTKSLIWSLSHAVIDNYNYENRKLIDELKVSDPSDPDAIKEVMDQIIHKLDSPEYVKYVRSFQIKQQTYTASTSKCLSIDDLDSDEDTVEQSFTINKDYPEDKNVLYYNFKKFIEEPSHMYLQKVVDFYHSCRDEVSVSVKNDNELRTIIEAVCEVNPQADLNWLDVSEVTDMYGLFMDSDFNGDISKWNVSNVKDFRYMFYKSAFSGNISKWNINPDAKTDNMFLDCPIEETNKPQRK